MNEFRPPLTSTSALFIWRPRERKRLLFSPSHCMFSLILAQSLLYRHRKSEHHLGTKAAKNIIVLSVLICEMVCICKVFHRHRLFDNAKSNTIFYNARTTALKSLPRSSKFRYLSKLAAAGDSSTVPHGPASAEAFATASCIDSARSTGKA